MPDVPVFGAGVEAQNDGFKFVMCQGVGQGLGLGLRLGLGQGLGLGPGPLPGPLPGPGPGWCLAASGLVFGGVGLVAWRRRACLLGLAD